MSPGALCLGLTDVHTLLHMHTQQIFCIQKVPFGCLSQSSRVIFTVYINNFFFLKQTSIIWKGKF